MASSSNQTAVSISKFTGDGWQLVSQTAEGIQFRKPKQVSRTGLILGLVLLLAFGIGLIVWILTGVSYLLNHDKLVFVPVQKLQDGVKPTENGSFEPIYQDPVKVAALTKADRIGVSWPSRR